MLRLGAEDRKTRQLDLHARASARVNAGHLDDAVADYLSLLSQRGDNAAWWHELAMLRARLGQFPAGVDALLTSLTLDSTAADRYHDLGTLLEHVPEPAAAVRDFIDGLPPGHRCMVQHHVSEALATYEAAYHADPDNSALAMTLSSALRVAGDEGRAALLLGHAAYRDQRHSVAIRALTKALSLGHADAGAHVELATALNRKWRYAEAIDVCQAGIERHPKEGGLYRALVNALVETNQAEEAAAAAEAGATALSDPWFLAAERHLSLPIVYDTAEQIGQWRARFSDGLRRMADISLDGPDAIAHARETVHPSFFLGYQGLDDHQLQREHGQLIHRIMRASYPHWADAPPLPPAGPDGTLRIGYVFVGNAGIDPLFLGWMTGHDRSRFEIVAYQVGGAVGPSSHPFTTAATRFHHVPEDLEGLCRRILEDQLHVLVFLYLGMSPMLSQLAGLRMAPIQCAAWGHPITTGLPTIDYFISNDLMEPDNAAAHYTETLERLPGLGVSLPPLFLPPLRKTRSEFGLPDDAVLYVSIQASAKYLPQHDHVLPAIARRVPNALFVLMERRGSQVMDVLRHRLRNAFERAGLDGDRFVRVLPKQEFDAYLDLLQVADVFLDTIGWSGGLTTLDAVQCGLPVVTLPGEFLRGRQSTGILKQMGVEDTIAASLDEYVEIAARLGLDGQWRRHISARLLERRSRLSDDRTWLPALEDFYRRIVSARRLLTAPEPPRENRMPQSARPSSHTRCPRSAPRPADG